MTIHLPKTLPPCILTLETRFQHTDFKRDTNIQSRTGIGFGCFLSKFAGYNLDLRTDLLIFAKEKCHFKITVPYLLL